jgi:DNA polymerase II small subunit
MANEILKTCMEKGFLLDKEILNLFSILDEKNSKDLIDCIYNLKIKERVVTKSFFLKNFDKFDQLISRKDVILEKFFLSIGCVRLEAKELTKLDEKKDENYVKVLSSPVIGPKKVDVQDFVKHFKARYNQMRGILEGKNLENLTTIRKIGQNRDNYTVIAAVLQKRITKNKNILLEVEDPTGKATILINQNKEELFNQAKDLLQDDIVAFQVMGSSEILFGNNIFYPDAFLAEKRKSEKEVLVAFTSDWHVGSSLFLEKNLLNFIKWINGEIGDEKQKELAKKIKYLFLTGDNIDGVGVYPEQNKMLKIMDIRNQYKKLTELLNIIRKDIKIIMCPGQHDGVRVAEPQPIVEESWAEDLHKVENLTLVPNPALIEIYDGFKVLMYHGASMHSLIDEIEDIRFNYKSSSPVRIVKELLKRRHLAPTHGSVVYIPNEKEDPLVISQIPDIVATGDLHRPDIGVYNNIMMIASSCWQSITPFEEKVGNNPDPCKVPILNLKTRELKILDFSGEEEKEHANVQGEKVIENQEVKLEVKQ